jgi:Ras-related protein Rab-21
VLRYVNNVFSDKQEATVQASYLTKRLVVEGVPITLSIWVRCHLLALIFVAYFPSDFQLRMNMYYTLLQYHYIS